MFSMGSDFDNIGSCRRFYSCKTKKRQQCLFLKGQIRKNIKRECKLFWCCTDLLLRKQFWITLMMKEAASFSLTPGLNRCLNTGKSNHEQQEKTIYKAYSNSNQHAHPHSLEQFDSLSSEAGQASVQHECNQGDHSIHVGSNGPEEDGQNVYWHFSGASSIVLTL